MRLLYDFYLFYAAGAVALKGGNFYDLNLLKAEMLANGFATDHPIWGFPYPPWAITFFAPMALLPFHLAQIVWFGLSAYAIYWCWKETGLRWIYLLLFFPAIKLLLFGQTAFLPLIGLVGFLRFNSFAWLALTAIKPHLIAPLVGAVGAERLRKRDYKQIVVFILVFLAQLLVAIIISPKSLIWFFEGLNKFQSDTTALYYPNIYYLLLKITGIKLPIFIIWGAFLLACTVYGLIRPISNKTLLLVILPLSLVLTPYLWAHDFVLLMPLYVLMLKQLLNMRSHILVMILLFMLFIILSMTLLSEGMEFYTILQPILLTAIALRVVNNETVLFGSKI